MSSDSTIWSNVIAYGVLLIFLLFTVSLAGLFAYRFVQFCQGVWQGLHGIETEPCAFEMKLNTGSSPVLKQKENDHG